MVAATADRTEELNIASCLADNGAHKSASEFSFTEFSFPANVLARRSAPARKKGSPKNSSFTNVFALRIAPAREKGPRKNSPFTTV